MLDGIYSSPVGSISPKTKIFSTIGAQAPDGRTLFASFGPVVTIAAISYSIMLMWRGKEGKSSLIHTWNMDRGCIIHVVDHGHFIFNAGPPMAVVGGIGLTAMWAYANPTEFVKHWRKTVSDHQGPDSTAPSLRVGPDQAFPRL